MSNLDLFINKSIEKFGKTRFNYDSTRKSFISQSKPVKMHCNVHKLEFTIENPANHFKTIGGGCAKCTNEAKKEKETKVHTDAFIAKSIEHFGAARFNYDITRTTFVTTKQPFEIFCNTHTKVFTIKNASNHTKTLSGGCPECTTDSRKAGYKKRDLEETPVKLQVEPVIEPPQKKIALQTNSLSKEQAIAIKISARGQCADCGIGVNALCEKCVPVVNRIIRENLTHHCVFSVNKTTNKCGSLLRPEQVVCEKHLAQYNDTKNKIIRCNKNGCHNIIEDDDESYCKVCKHNTNVTNRSQKILSRIDNPTENDLVFAQTATYCEMKDCSRFTIQGKWCGKHIRLGKLYDDNAEGINYCSNYIRGCNSILSKDYRHKKCQMCLNNIEHKIVECKRGAQRNGRQFTLTDEQCATLFLDNCYYCGEIPGIGKNNQNTTDVTFLNGIDRKDNKLHYHINNCVTACKMCNFMKGKLENDLSFIKICSHFLSNLGMIDKKEYYPEMFLNYISTSYDGNMANASQRNMEHQLTKTEYYSIVSNDCYMCGKKNSNCHNNGIDRILNDAPYTLANSRACCATCNYIKREYKLNDLIVKMLKIYHKHKKTPFKCNLENIDRIVNTILEQTPIILNDDAVNIENDRRRIVANERKKQNLIKRQQ